MKRYLLPQEGRFYKANLHAHSTVSDGHATPEALKDAYRARGYSILAITDHDVMVDHSDLNDDGFLALRGYEMEINERGKPWPEMKTCHLNFIARSPAVDKQVFFSPTFNFIGNAGAYAKTVRYVGEPVYDRTYSPVFLNRLIRAANAAGFLVTCNHPHWSLQTTADCLPLEGLFGMEVLNGAGASLLSSVDEGTDIYESMLRAGYTALVPIAADDNHNIYGFDGAYTDSFRGFMMIKAPALTYGDVIAALENGDCYASAGPEIRDLYVEDGVLHIVSSPVREMRLHTRGRNGAWLHLAGDALFENGEIPLDKDWGWFRLEITDAAGRRAYTRAYPVAD